MVATRLARLFVGLVMVAVTVAPAQAQRLSLVRDTETERVLTELARPVFQAAGVVPSAVDMLIVNDNVVNAFVTGGQNIFFTTGFLMQAETALEVLGVIAHETGHIAGGHLARGSDAIEDAATRALIATLIGIAAGIAAGSSDVVAATALGGQQAAVRGFLSFSRSMESAADQAALTYLDRTGISSEGLLDFLARLEDQELLPASRQVEYVRTHPLTRDRVDFIRNHVAQSPATGNTLPPGLELAFSRVRAKLIGYFRPQIALAQFSADDPNPAVRYGYAVALYRQARIDDAAAVMRGLLAEAPNDPFYNEMLGQILMDGGRISEARPYYEQADRILPGEPLILVRLAQIRLEEGRDIDTAVIELNRVVSDPRGRMPFAWRLLARGYGLQGDLGMAALALAEEALAMGEPEDALEQAARAEPSLPYGSPGWLRLQDLRRVAEDLRDD